MPDVLMSPERVPAKFSMTEAEPPRDVAAPPLRRAARFTRDLLLRLRSFPARPVRRDRATSAAAW